VRFATIQLVRACKLRDSQLSLAVHPLESVPQKPLGKRFAPGMPRAKEEAQKRQGVSL